MAESTNNALPDPAPNGVEQSARSLEPFKQKYSIPIPLRIFPLPAFYPNNPVSLLHLAVAWLGQIFYPPSAEPSVVYHGIWSAETRSVHVTDLKSMNDLWRQGFFGKGSLSRSEPTWLKRQLGETIEQRTNKRREQRVNTKWERGRTELEAIERMRLEESQAPVKQTPKSDDAHIVVSLPVPKNDTSRLFRAPVGPLELLALPNSQTDLERTLGECKRGKREIPNGRAKQPSFCPPVGPLELLALPNSEADLRKAYSQASSTEDREQASGDEVQPLKPQKSVRFAAEVESTTFQHTDPPSPNHSTSPVTFKQVNGIRTVNGKAKVENGVAKEPVALSLSSEPREETETTAELVNKEHLQLSGEEAFFLAYGLGALVVTDPETQKPLKTSELFTVCRRFSYFPPRMPDEALSTDDPFLVHYAVYHHFRSLGWVPRHGIKFGVDWLLYGKGPALDHAEFGVIVMPSYTDVRWKGYQGGTSGVRGKSWHWLHSVNRVLSTVFKSLVLVYVDIPPPSDTGDSPSELLQKFRIREVMVRRWSSNRNRD